jgi:hypothetical protein
MSKQELWEEGQNLSEAEAGLDLLSEYLILSSHEGKWDSGTGR